MKINLTVSALAGGILALLACSAAQSGTLDSGRKSSAAAPKPTISITSVPPRGAGPDSDGAIAGIVTNADPESCRVVIYSHTDKWYVQPTTAAPLTRIASDGKWTADIHLGYNYAAMLVPASYDAPATLENGQIPPPDAPILAIARADPPPN